MARKRKKKKSRLLTIIILVLIGTIAYAGASVYQDLRHLWRDGDQDYDFGEHDLDPPPPEDFVPDIVDEPAEKDEFADYSPNPDVLNILLIGVDQPAAGSRRAPLSDAIIIFSINRKTGKTVLLSVPRDTYVSIEGRGMDKINHSHAFGGAKLLTETVENFLEIPIHYYFRVNFEGFTNLIDIVGGVNIDVNVDIPKKKIQKGQQVLTSKQALSYVRYRGDSDYRRTGRQQQLLIAMAKQIQSQSLHRLPAIINEGVKHTDTNMPLLTLLDFANRFQDSDAEKTTRYTLSGQGFTYNGVFYIQTNMTATRQFVAKYFRIPPQ